MPSRSAVSKPSMRVLVVSDETTTRSELADRVRRAKPAVEVEGVASFADAVLRLARGAMDAVVLDLTHLPPLSVAAPVVLRGMAPAVRIVAVGGGQVGGGIDHLPSADSLKAWLAAGR